MPYVHGIEINENIDVVFIKRPPNIPGIVYRAFSAMANEGIDLDLIIQVSSKGSADVIFTVYKNDSKKTEDILRSEFKDCADTEISVDTESVKLTVFGDKMQGKLSTSPDIFKCLWDSDIRIKNISSSESRVSMLIDREDGKRAFDLLNHSLKIDY